MEDLSARVERLSPWLLDKEGKADPPVVGWIQDPRSSSQILRDYERCKAKVPTQFLDGPLGENALAALLADSEHGCAISTLSNLISQLSFLLASSIRSHDGTNGEVCQHQGMLALLAYLQSPWSVFLPSRRAILRRRAGELLRSIHINETDWNLLRSLPATTMEEDSQQVEAVVATWLDGMCSPTVDSTPPATQSVSLGISPDDIFCLSPSPYSNMDTSPVQSLTSKLVSSEDLIDAERAWPVAVNMGNYSSTTTAERPGISSPLPRQRRGSRLRPPRPPRPTNGGHDGGDDDEDTLSALQNFGNQVQRMLTAAQLTRSALVADAARLGSMMPKAEEHLAAVASALRISKAMSWSGKLTFLQEILFLGIALGLFIFTVSLIFGTLAIA